MATPNRWQKKTDANHTSIVTALEKIGCSVYDMSRVGGGFPDICVGYRQCNWLLEIKTEKGTLNEKQKDFFDLWRGQKCIVRSPEEAIQVVTNG